MCFLFLGELGLFPTQAALCLGNGHAFPGPCPDQVCFEFGDHGQDIEEEPADGIGGVVDGAAEAELDFAAGELIHYVLGVAQRPAYGHRSGLDVMISR